MIQAPGLIDIPVKPTGNLTLSEMDELIADATREIQEFEEMKLKAAGATEAELRAEIAGIKEGLEGEENPQGKEIRKNLEMAEKEVKEIQEKASELEDEKKEQAGTVDKIAGNVKSKADGLAKSMQSSDVWLKKGSTGNLPIPILIDATGITVKNFTKPAKSTRILTADFGSEFSRIAAGIDPGSSYIVFFVMPSGISNLTILRKICSDHGVSVGFQPTEEGADIRLSPESA